MENLNELKSLLSKEWNKPKQKNLRKKKILFKSILHNFLMLIVLKYKFKKFITDCNNFINKKEVIIDKRSARDYDKIYELQGRIAVLKHKTNVYKFKYNLQR